MLLTALPSRRRVRRLLLTSSLSLTFTAIGSGAVPLPQATAAPHPVHTAVHTLSLGAPAMAVARGARVPALTAATLSRAAADGAPAPAGLRPAVASGPLRTAGFSLVGVTWDGTVPEGSFAAWVRTRAGGAWTGWSALPQESAEHAPDPGTAEAAHERAGTDPVVVAHSDGVEVRVDTRSGAAPAGLRVDLVEPGRPTPTRRWGPRWPVPRARRRGAPRSCPVGSGARTRASSGPPRATAPCGVPSSTTR